MKSAIVPLFSNNLPLSSNNGGLFRNNGRLLKSTGCQADAIGGDGDEMTFVEVADGLLVGLFGNTEAGGDILGR